MSWAMAVEANGSVYDGAGGDKWTEGGGRPVLAAGTDLHWDRQISLGIRPNHPHILETRATGKQKGGGGGERKRKKRRRRGRRGEGEEDEEEERKKKPEKRRRRRREEREQEEEEKKKKRRRR